MAITSCIDVPRVDAHCHLWQLDRGDYAWLDRSDPKLKKIARDFGVADLTKARKRVGVSQVIVVQAAATEAETEYLLSLADQNQEIAGVVGWVDLSSKNAIASIDKFSTNPSFKGIRPMLQDIEDTNWLLDVPAANVWEILKQKNLRFDALIRPRHLPMTHQFCLQHPELKIVIDHAAKPDIANGDDEAFEFWCSNMAAIANQTHAFCKISGLLTEMRPEQLPNASMILKPIIDHLIESFGPERLMWGSDWPVVRLAGDYNIWNELTLELLQDLNQKSQTSILSGTASRFYGVTEAQG